MNKKHLIALADALRAVIGSREHACKTTPLPLGGERACMVVGHTETINRVIEAVAQVCEDSNPKFNRFLWKQYIYNITGPNGGKLPAHD